MLHLISPLDGKGTTTRCGWMAIIIQLKEGWGATEKWAAYCRSVHWGQWQLEVNLKYPLAHNPGQAPTVVLPKDSILQPKFLTRRQRFVVQDEVFSYNLSWNTFLVRKKKFILFKKYYFHWFI